MSFNLTGQRSVPKAWSKCGLLIPALTEQPWLVYTRRAIAGCGSPPAMIAIDWVTLSRRTDRTGTATTAVLGWSFEGGMGSEIMALSSDSRRG